MNTLFEIGNGENNESRSNAFVVYKNGSARLGNELVITKKYADEHYGGEHELNIMNGAASYSLVQKGHEEEQVSATGEYSIALGGKTYNIDGDPNDVKLPTIASGILSFAANGSTLADGDMSASFGKDSKAYGMGTFVEGGSNRAGDVNTPQNQHSFLHAEGEGNIVTGRSSHIEGIGNKITNSYGAHVEG